MSDEDEGLTKQEFKDFNRNLIEEFRSNDGKVGGMFEGAPLLLLTTTGAKTGTARIAPLAYTKDNDRFVVIASKGGAPSHPDWYYNLCTNPDVTVEVGTDAFPARATIQHGAERQRLFDQMSQKMPNFAEYQRNTRRELPVILLERIQ